MAMKTSGPGAKLKACVRGSRAGGAPWSWSIIGFWTFNGSRKLAHFSKILKRENQIFCVIFAKITAMATRESLVTTKLEGGAWSKTGGLCSPGSGLKPPLSPSLFFTPCPLPSYSSLPSLRTPLPPPLFFPFPGVHTLQLGV